MKKFLCLVVVILCVCTAFSGCDQMIGQKKVTTITKYEPIDETKTSQPQSSSKPQQSNTSSKKPKPPKNDVSSKLPTSSSSSEFEIITLPEGDSSLPLASNTSSSYEELEKPTFELPCYSKLTENQKITYQVISQMVKRHTDGFKEIPCKSTSDISVVYNAVSSDHPEYFWMPHQYVIAKGGDAYYIAMDYEGDDYNFNYLYTKEQVKSMQAEINQSVEKIKAYVTETSSLGKEKMLHDWLCDNVFYSPNLEEESAFNIYGALVKGFAVCEGYSRAMQYLCNIYKIDCILVTGYSSGVGHMWNQIKIEDNWYNLDITWDDPDSESTPIWYSYFNVDDNILEIDHVFDPLVKNIYDEDIDNGDTFNILRMDCTSLEANYGASRDRIITANAQDADFVIKSAFFGAGADDLKYIDFFFSADIPINRYFTEQIYQMYKMDLALEANNRSALLGGRVLLSLRSYAKKGQCYRVYFE